MMTISTKGRYGLRLLLDLAEHREDGYIALKDIAERQNVSKKYLEQIVPVYTSAGILKTVRGAQGGYMLAKAPEECTVGEILRFTEGDLVPVPCANPDAVDCDRVDGCITVVIWQGLYQTINSYLDTLTLADVLEQFHSR